MERSQGEFKLPPREVAYSFCVEVRSAKEPSALVMLPRSLVAATLPSAANLAG